MWTCRNCKAGFDFAQVEPEVDEQGFFVTVQQLGSRLYRIASKGPL